ncbi:G-protein coupled receptor 39-like [Heterodontus francisci]|uniref:G-protein coupled receptor 39-like n=1 Tax=Heterodontus francisci TaxID=7792 RepID=UPI00355BC5B1
MTLEYGCNCYYNGKESSSTSRDSHIVGTLENTNVYCPLLATVGEPVNLMTIVVLSWGKCGLSKCVTRYLVFMALADLLVIIIDLILKHIPIIYQLKIVEYIPLCNIHSVLLYAATDCCVWITVTFTFDQFVAICCQNLKSKYCTEKMATLVLGTVTVLSCLKNTFWYFMYTVEYWLLNDPWFCIVRNGVLDSPVWAAVELIHFILTPGDPICSDSAA